jgi:hypothetical protein
MIGTPAVIDRDCDDHLLYLELHVHPIICIRI